MQTHTIYEEEILREVQELPESFQERLARIIHLLKRELLVPAHNEKRATEEFLSVCGTWEDDRSVNRQREELRMKTFDVNSSRGSLW